VKWCEFLFNQIYWVMFSIWLPFKLRLFINFDWVGSWDATYNLFSIEQNSNWKNLQWNNRSEVLSTYLSLSLSHTHTHTHTTTHTHTRTHTHTHTHTSSCFCVIELLPFIDGPLKLGLNGWNLNDDLLLLSFTHISLFKIS
jgi:hypothetical protein